MMFVLYFWTISISVKPLNYNKFKTSSYLAFKMPFSNYDMAKNPFFLFRP